MNLSYSVDTTTRVRYSETDKMGYVYYGNYPTYFEMGRVECLRTLGLSYKEMEDNGVMLPVKDLNVQYKSPAKYDDLLTIRTKITELSGSRIFFTYSILNTEGKLLTVGETTLVFVSAENMRPIRPSQTIIDTLKPYEVHA